VLHSAASELLGVYVLDACEESEAAAVRRHLSACAVCEAEALRLSELAGWLGASEEATPPRALRPRVLEQVAGDDQP
jgi:anti-sigma factor RsiW